MSTLDKRRHELGSDMSTPSNDDDPSHSFLLRLSTLHSTDRIDLHNVAVSERVLCASSPVSSGGLSECLGGFITRRGRAPSKVAITHYVSMILGAVVSKLGKNSR